MSTACGGRCPSLTALILATWQVARVLAVRLVEAVLAERARQPTAWPPCPVCGASLRSKGLAPRQMMSLFGPIRWRRRVGRCPHGCDIPQVAPLDATLGVQAHQHTSGELHALGCALAVFVPFATAARLLGWYCGGVVSPRAVWCWVQAAGHQAMTDLQADLDAVDRDDVPPPEPLPVEWTALPLALGADGATRPRRHASARERRPWVRHLGWQAAGPTARRHGGTVARLGVGAQPASLGPRHQTGRS
jgi:hypothetical protein